MADRLVGEIGKALENDLYFVLLISFLKSMMPNEKWYLKQW